MSVIWTENKLDIAIQETIKQAGAILRSACLSVSAIHEKEGMANFCTDYDLQIQRFLMDRLFAIVPNCNFYGEEDMEGNREHTKSPYTFFIDPIDGTTNVTIIAACPLDLPLKSVLSRVMYIIPMWMKCITLCAVQ